MAERFARQDLQALANVEGLSADQAERFLEGGDRKVPARTERALTSPPA